MLILALVVILILIVGAFVAFVGSSNNVRKTNDQKSDPSLSFDSQALYRPVRSLRNAIDELAETSTDPAVRAMAPALQAEVKDAHDRVVRALETRDQLRRATNHGEDMQAEVERLLSLRESAASPQEKLSYTKAYEAKLNEKGETEHALALIKKIEDEIELTKASLSELKSKLSVQGPAGDAAVRAEELRSSLGSLDVIQSSVAEAQEMLRA